MSAHLLIFIEEKISDDHLSFMDMYIPDIIREKASASGIVDNIYYSIPESYSGKLKSYKNVLIRKSIDDIVFWKEILEKTGFTSLIKIYGDSPFFDISIIKEMLEQHKKYLAEFTFSENVPEGLACEIISMELVKDLPETDKKTLSLSEVVRTNINRFDVELYYRDPDIRDKRISFRSGNLRGKKIMENIYKAAKGIPAYEKIKDIIETDPEILYAGPSYAEIELTGRCQLNCIFCYRKTLQKVHGDMDTSTFKKIIREMWRFELPYTICLGGSGEPLLHPGLYEMLEHANNDALVDKIIIETNGIDADSNFSGFLEKTENNKIITIVNINGYNNETYKKLHGEDYFNRVFNNIESLKFLNSEQSKKLYVQIMKINETEDYLDRYYDFWEKQNIPIILQKQNTYLGRIEDRTYSDLSPLERTPCWHLQRDVFILWDGRVTFCKEDVSGKYFSASINSESLTDIWNRKKEIFVNNYKSELSKEPDCNNCDEWYTFNF